MQHGSFAPPHRFPSLCPRPLSQGRIQLIRMSKNAAGNHKIKRLNMSKTAIHNKGTHAINIDELDHIFDTDRIIE
jgi:type III restriction enzyme